MEFLQTWLDSSTAPFLSALILGLMTAISPCPLAMNITAIAFIGKDLQDKRRVFLNGILYTLGRAIAYIVIALILYFGASEFKIQKIFSGYGERIVGPLLIIIGLLMLNIIPLKIPGIGKLNDRMTKINYAGSYLKVLLLGVVFALAFCPYSAVLYFGMLIPISIASPEGLYLPFIYAIATGLPVIIAAWLLAFTVAGIGTFYAKVKNFEKWFRWIVALVFIIVGFYYVYIFFF